MVAATTSGEVEARALVRGALGRARLLGHIVPDKVLVPATSVAGAVAEVTRVPYVERSRSRRRRRRRRRRVTSIKNNIAGEKL